MTHFRILQLESPGIPHRPGGLGRYMHDSFENEITFWVDADQLKMIPLTLKIMRSAKLEQMASENLCSPTIPWGPLKLSVENASPPSSMTLNVWDEDSFSCQGDDTWYCTLNNYREISNCIHSTTLVPFPGSSTQPQDSVAVMNISRNIYTSLPFPEPKCQNTRIWKGVV